MAACISPAHLIYSCCRKSCYAQLQGTDSWTVRPLSAGGLVKETLIKDEVRDSLQKELQRDEKTQLIVGCIGSAADIIEFVSETVGDQPDDLCNSKLHLILWLCWSLRKIQNV